MMRVSVRRTVDDENVTRHTIFVCVRRVKNRQNYERRRRRRCGRASPVGRHGRRQREIHACAQNTSRRVVVVEVAVIMKTRYTRSRARTRTIIRLTTILLL